MKLTFITLALGVLIAAPLPQNDRLEGLKADLLEDFMRDAGIETHSDERRVFEDHKSEKIIIREDENEVESHIDELIEKIEEIQEGDRKIKVHEVEEITDTGDDLVLIDDVVIDEEDQEIIEEELELIDEASVASEDVGGFTDEDYEEIDMFYDPKYLRKHTSKKGGRGGGRRHRGRRPSN